MYDGTRAIFILAIICLFIPGHGYGNQPSRNANLDASNFPSIQAALDKLPSTGGVVEIPAGIYRISEPLVIDRSNVTLRGVGRSTVVLNQNRDGGPAITARPNKDTGENPLWGITIANMLITGDTAAVWKAEAWPADDHFLKDGGDAVVADHCYNSLFQTLWIVGNGGNGLNLL